MLRSFSLIFALTLGVSLSLSLASGSLSWAAKAKKSKTAKAKVAAPAEPSHHLRLAKVAPEFRTPPELREAVDFWILAYTRYDKNSEIFHDTENLNVIYSVMDISDLYRDYPEDRVMRKTKLTERIEAEEARIIALLKSIHEKQAQPATLDAEEKKIFELFAGDPNPKRFLEAADPKRIRSQTGVREKFVEAIANSGAYISHFEGIFKEHGLPVEMSRLAFVESMFNLRIVSKVGASGMWQFMPDTGRHHGLRVDDRIDERNDPLLAAHAAAALLKSNRDKLGNWLVAMNAYNSGVGNLKSAIASVGNNSIVNIIQHYRGGSYGFASRNFVPSFLAVLEITQDYPKHFEKISVRPKLEFETYQLSQARKLGELLEKSSVDRELFLNLNPQFGARISNDEEALPANYPFRIPPKTKVQFAKAEGLDPSTLTKNETEKPDSKPLAP